MVYTENISALLGLTSVRGSLLAHNYIPVHHMCHWMDNDVIHMHFDCDFEEAPGPAMVNFKINGLFWHANAPHAAAMSWHV